MWAPLLVVLPVVSSATRQKVILLEIAATVAATGASENRTPTLDTAQALLIRIRQADGPEKEARVTIA